MRFAGVSARDNICKNKVRKCERRGISYLDFLFYDSILTVPKPIYLLPKYAIVLEIYLMDTHNFAAKLFWDDIQ